MGLLGVLLLERLAPTRYLRPVLGIGVLGGYTTFSTMATEGVRLLDQGRFGLAVGYWVAAFLAVQWPGWAMTVNRPGEEDIAWLLSRAAHQLNERLWGVLEAEGLTLGQWWVLGLLSDGAGHGMSEAADHAMVPAPTLTKAVDQLVAANLVYRRADRHDRRRVLIYLTPRGRRFHARLAGKLGGIVGGVVDGDEVAQLTQLLLRVLQRLR